MQLRGGNTMGKYFPDLPARTLGQMGDVKDNPVHLVAEEIYAKWPVGYLWGKNNGTSGEHPKGLALDFSGLAYKTPTVGGAMDHAKCQAIADYLWKHRKRLGVWYVIWNRQIISMTYESQGWRPYTGASPHTDHVHASFYSAPNYQPPTTAPKPQPEPAPEPTPSEDVVAGVLPAQLVQVTDTRAVYAVGFTGAVHVKNPTHLRFLREQGWVTEDIKQISAAELVELLERE